MATTALSIIGVPGKPHSFLPKSSATGTHEGNFTELSVTAIPGRQHSFLPKSAVGGHDGNFTELSVIAVPGRRHSFTGKTPAVVDIPEEILDAGSSYYDESRGIYRKLISVHRDDEEILQTIIAFVLNGSE